MPDASYWRWTPDLPDGLYDTPFLGELVPGRVVEVPADKTRYVANNPDWERAKESHFKNQPDLAEDKQRFAVPADPEEE